jgi:hypothetical protein
MKMKNKITTDHNRETPTSQVDTSQFKLNSKLTWALLIGGGFMGGWGTFVTVALLVILATNGPGTGGIVPFLLGSVVIGLAPMGFGGFLFHIGRQRRRESQLDDDSRS